MPHKLSVCCRQFYGDLYSSADFHHRKGDGFSVHGNCQIQDQDFHSCYDCVQQCDLGGLADLDTSEQSVQVLSSQCLSFAAVLCLIHALALDAHCTACW